MKIRVIRYDTVKYYDGTHEILGAYYYQLLNIKENEFNEKRLKEILEDEGIFETLIPELYHLKDVNVDYNLSWEEDQFVFAYNGVPYLEVVNEDYKTSYY